MCITQGTCTLLAMHGLSFFSTVKAERSKAEHGRGRLRTSWRRRHQRLAKYPVSAGFVYSFVLLWTCSYNVRPLRCLAWHMWLED
jgi:hypothetical protein